MLESSEAASVFLPSCRDEWAVRIDYSPVNVSVKEKPYALRECSTQAIFALVRSEA